MSNREDETMPLLKQARGFPTTKIQGYEPLPSHRSLQRSQVAPCTPHYQGYLDPNKFQFHVFHLKYLSSSVLGGPGAA